MDHFRSACGIVEVAVEDICTLEPQHPFFVQREDGTRLGIADLCGESADETARGAAAVAGLDHVGHAVREIE